MKLWQYLAFISGTIIAIAMALGSISYNATLGTSEAAFRWLPISNTMVFSFLALAFDLGMIASVFGFLHWRRISRVGAGVCAALFLIASLFSIHSVRGYIALNLTKSMAPVERSADVYASLKFELRNDQEHLARLREKKLNARRRERALLQNDIAQLSRKIHDTRTHLAQASTGKTVSPIHGLEWFLAITLWFFNSTCWSAWFGFKSLAPVVSCSNDTVSAWLSQFDLSEPIHCTALYDAYRRWCERKRRQPLAQYSFYARLIELGARKFRDGRNGPTNYVMPASTLVSAAA